MPSPQPATTDPLHDALDALADHCHRSVRAFLDRPGAAEEPFWFLIYGNRRDVTVSEAKAVHAELQQSRKSIQDVLDGWRPDSLKREE